jgi:hypothetical protein
MGPERELRLLASVAAGDAWLFCPRAGPSLSSCARSWTPRASLTSTVASVCVKLRLQRRGGRGERLPLESPGGCLPKPSNQDHPPLFRELRPLNAKQHIARS